VALSSMLSPTTVALPDGAAKEARRARDVGLRPRWA
jgi:hypothetical protein